MLRRRHFLRGSLGLLAAGTLPIAGRSQTIIASQPIGEQIFLFQGAGQNVVVVQSGEGLLLVDGGSEQHAEALLETLGNQFDFLPVNTLINTHWHPEQTGLNLLLGSAGTRIIAHENTRLWLGTETIVRWQDRIYPPVPAPALPSTSFHATHTLDVDGESVQCGYLLQAHTDGDIYVHFPERKVLVAGGVLSSNSWPVIDWSTAGWIGGMVKALDTLLALSDDDTVIVPATGLPIRRPELAAQREMYAGIMAQLKIMMEKGYGIAEVLREAPTAGFKPDWPGAEQFLELAFRSFWGHVRQFDVV